VGSGGIYCVDAGPVDIKELFMRDITYKTLDYIYDNDWVRRVWLAVAWLGLLICTYEPEGWRFGTAVVCGVLLHWHGVIDGAKAAIEGVKK
jgi:hypothetical protein